MGRREVGINNHAATCAVEGTCLAEGKTCGRLLAIHGLAHRTVPLSRGDRVPTDSENAQVIRTVQSGFAALCASLPDGRRQILCLAGPGESLCTASTPGLACWIEALTSSLLCEVAIKPERLDGECRSRATSVLGELVRNRLEGAFAHIVALGRLDGAERLAGFLVNMAHRIGRFEHGVWLVPLPMSRDDIADHLGLNADTITRKLRHLQRIGLVRGRFGSELVLPNLSALLARAPRLAAASVEATPERAQAPRCGTS